MKGREGGRGGEGPEQARLPRHVTFSDEPPPVTKKRPTYHSGPLESKHGSWTLTDKEAEAESSSFHEERLQVKEKPKEENSSQRRTLQDTPSARSTTRNVRRVLGTRQGGGDAHASEVAGQSEGRHGPQQAGREKSVARVVRSWGLGRRVGV